MCNKESVLCIMLPTPSEGASRCSVLLSCDCELWNSWCAAKWENQRCVLGSFWYQGNSRTTYLVEFASEHVSELAHHSQQHLLQVDVSCLLGKKQLADEAVKTYFSKSSLWSEHRDTVSIQSEKQGLHFSKLLSIAGSYLRVLELQALTTLQNDARASSSWTTHSPQTSLPVTFCCWLQVETSIPAVHVVNPEPQWQSKSEIDGDDQQERQMLLAPGLCSDNFHLNFIETFFFFCAAVGLIKFQICTNYRDTKNLKSV